MKVSINNFFLKDQSAKIIIMPADLEKKFLWHTLNFPSAFMSVYINQCLAGGDYRMHTCRIHSQCIVL